MAAGGKGDYQRIEIDLSCGPGPTRYRSHWTQREAEMFKPKKGDKVLVEAAWGSMSQPQLLSDGTTDEHLGPCLLKESWNPQPHPGVPISDLLELAEIAYKEEFGSDPPEIPVPTETEYGRKLAIVNAVRASQEAANEPKLELGQRVEADGRLDGIAKLDDGYLLLQMRVAPGNVEIKGDHPDDIRQQEDSDER